MGSAEEEEEANNDENIGEGSSNLGNFDNEEESTVDNPSNELCHATAYQFDMRARRKERWQITAEYDTFRSWLLRTDRKHILDEFKEFLSHERLEGRYQHPPPNT